MRKQTILILVLALTFGGIAAFGVLFYSTQQGSKTEDEATMVLAAVEVPRGESLTAELMKVVTVPRKSLFAGVVSTIDQADGRSTLMPLIAGEPILDAKLAPKGAGRGLSSLIKKGMRAISIPTPNVGSGVAGFIIPGSHVDIYWNSQMSSVEGHLILPDPPLLENVEVLAVDDKVDYDAANRTAATQIKSVTVQVRPEDASRLTPALSKGTIHLSLRNPGDDTRVPPPPAPVPVEEQATMVLAATDVPRGTQLAADMLKVMKVPKNALLKGAVTKLEEVEGRSTLLPLIAGEPIMAAKLATKGADRGLASLIKKGMRAVTIATPNVGSGVAGFILPGSHVDIHWHSGQGSESGSTIASPVPPLLEDVEVLAVDDKVDLPSATASRTAAIQQMKSVTVQVNPEDAARLTPVLAKGTIYLSLRNPGDAGRIPPVPVANATTVQDATSPRTRVIRILRGSREMKFEFEVQADSANPAH